MKIQQTNITTSTPVVINKKQETEPKDQVILGTTNVTPDFLKRPLILKIDNETKKTQGMPKSREELAKGGFFAAREGVYHIDGSLGGRIFPDSYGRIKHLAFQFGNKEFEKDLWPKTKEAILGVYETLFTNMSGDTKFTIIVPDAKSEETCKNLVKECQIENPERVHIVNAKSPNGFSIWIRDSMLPVKDEKGDTKLIIQDRTYWPGADDAMIPEAIDKEHDNVSSVRNPILRIDGGNILSNKDYAFIGNDSAAQTTELLKELSTNKENKQQIIHFYEIKSGKKVIEEGKPENSNEVTIEQMWNDVAPMVFESEFQRKVYIVGSDDPSTPDIIENQPVFHIDMCTTPIGEDTFIVGDPSMAINILKNLPPQEVERLNRKVGEESGVKDSTNLIGKLIEANSGDEYQRNFDNLANQLKEKGYNIHRMPYMSGLRTTWSLPYLTYNNCIQEKYTDENGKEVKKVYLPQYGMEPLDKMAHDMYKDFGYEVVPLHMAAITILEGAIRCSAYPIERNE